MGTIPVGPRGNAESWRINDTEVLIIALGDNGDPMNLGLTLWVLSHLTYPLAWVFEAFRMFKVGREVPPEDGEDQDMVYTTEIFSRLAGQVDIKLRKNKIIFVVPTKTRDNVELGGAVFPITATDKWSNMPNEHGPEVFNMDDHIVVMVESILNSPNGLREQFANYASSYFSTGFNWVEIDTLVTAIVPRFHQRIEGNRATRDGARLNTGAPSDILEAYGLNPCDGLTPDSYSDYGAEYAVTAMDMRATTRGRARRNPVLLLGSWSNMAELAVATGLAIYDVHNVEGSLPIRARLESGANDRLIRARFLRLMCENLKRSQGVTDTIAFPRDNPASLRYWPSLIGTNITEGGASLQWLARTMLTHTVKWSWSVNGDIQPGGSTLTGVRTVSGMWRTNSNTELGSISMTVLQYEMDTTVQRWSNDFWLQLGCGVDTPLMEYVLDRINMQSRDWEITYKSHPANNQVEGYSWVVDSTVGGILAGELGWREQDMAPPLEAIWGWGVQSMIKDYANDVLKTVCIGRVTAMTMSASTFTDHMVLFRGAIEDPVGNSFNIRVLDAPRGLNPAHFQKLASRDHPPGRQATVQGTNEAAMQAKIIELEQQIAALSTSRQVDEGRVKWNSDDGIREPNADALVGGTTPLDKQRVDPLKAQHVDGATRALMETQAVRPRTGEWQPGQVE